MVDDLDKVSLWLRFGTETNAFSSVEQYVIMIAASIPITVPAFRWIGEKLSGYRYAVASWTALNDKPSKGGNSLEERDGTA